MDTPTIHVLSRSADLMLRVVLLAAAIAVFFPAAPIATADTGVVVATVTVAEDASLTLRVSKGRLAAGIPFHIDAEFKGAIDGSGRVRLHVSPALLMKNSPAQDVRNHQKKARWSLCSDRPDTYVVMASLEWPDGRRLESEAIVVHIAPSKKSACPKPWV